MRNLAKDENEKNTLMELKNSLSAREFPSKFAQYLINKGAIYHWPAGRFYIVTKHQLAKEVLSNSAFTADRSKFFISRMPNLDLTLIQDFFAVVKKMMVMSDGRAHQQRRKFAAVGVNENLLKQYKPVIQHTVSQLINKAVCGNQLEFVKNIAEPLPSIILADLFCIPEEDRVNFYQWSKNMTTFFGGETEYNNTEGKRVNNSTQKIRNYFGHLIRQRRSNPADDFLSQLIISQKSYELSDEEIVAQATMMLVAGQVTTTDQLCNNLYTLLTQPNTWQTLSRDTSLLPPTLEECNRVDPGVTFIFREVKSPILLGGIALKPGDVVFLANHAINHDASLFNNPFTFDIKRNKSNQHMAYGFGPHFCLGSKLARIMMIECFEQLLNRYPLLRLDASKSAMRKHYSLAFSGFDSIHCIIYEANTND